ncbi:MAG: hypothetical protein OXF65_06570 [Acidimicrobiaceae bacterium]|nr:hypothetical protein [Acidimicrobiaceae bacterium]
MSDSATADPSLSKLVLVAQEKLSETISTKHRAGGHRGHAAVSNEGFLRHLDVCVLKYLDIEIVLNLVHCREVRKTAIGRVLRLTSRDRF